MQISLTSSERLALVAVVHGAYLRCKVDERDAAKSSQDKAASLSLMIQLESINDKLRTALAKANKKTSKEKRYEHVV